MKQRTFPISAFSLVEVTLALGVTAISMITIFGLLVTGSKINDTAVEQSASNDFLSAVTADLRATPKTNTTSGQFAINIPAGGATGSTTLYFNTQGGYTTALASDSRYRMVISFLNNGGNARTATFADIKITWPARAGETGANTSSAETFLALDRN